MLLLAVGAVILQAGIGTFPFVLALVVAAGFSAGPGVAMVSAVAGSVLLETISISPLGTLSLPLLLIAPVTFLLSQRLFQRRGVGSRTALLAVACVLAAGLAYGVAQLLASETLLWSIWELLRLAVAITILAGLWLWIIGRLKTPLRYGFPAV